MKKILLASSALAVAFAASAHADTPKITVGGFTDWQVGIMSDDADANQRSHAFFNDTEIDFNIDGKADNGLGYGAVITVEADVTNDGDGQGTNAARTFIYLDGSWGRVELGSNEGAATTMRVDASTIARATGGINGQWFRYANNPGANNYLAAPGLLLENGAHFLGGSQYVNENQDNTNKVSYYTPTWNGFQLGLSYAPNDSDRGQVIARANGPTLAAGGRALSNGLSRVENIFSGALTYEGSWDQVGIKLSASAENGDAERTGYEDLMAWNAGGTLSYMGFSFGASYGDWGDSLTLNTSNLDDTDYFTVGGAYEFGPYGISVTYLDSTYDIAATTIDNEFDLLSIGADYQLAPGLTPYAEITFYDADTATAANDNDGHVFILGTQLNF